MASMVVTVKSFSQSNLGGDAAGSYVLRPIRLTNPSENRSNYKCGICKGIPFYPMQASCGCRFCELCLRENPSYRLICPENEKEFCGPFSFEDVDKPRPDVAVRRSISQMEIFCPNECGAKMLMKDLLRHLHNSTKHSTFTITSNSKVCPRSACPDCKKVVSVNIFMKAHVLKPCHYCEKLIRNCIMDSIHLNPKSTSFCEKYKGICIYCMGRDETTRSNDVMMKQHRLVCKKWKQVCNFEVLGCPLDHKVSRKNEDFAQHTKMLYEYVVGSVSPSPVAHDLRTYAAELDQMLNKVRREPLANERLDRVLTHGEDVTTSADQVWQTSKKLNEVISNNPSPSRETFPIAPYIWRIERFLERRQSETLFDSPPFLSDHFAYKMKLRIYFNGDGNGRGTHLSAYVILLPHDFDVILQWPFNLTFVFILLDQTQEGNDYRQVIYPNPTSRSFSRPTRSDNESGTGARASGCSKLYPLEQLQQSPRYLRDGSLYLKFELMKAGHS